MKIRRKKKEEIKIDLTPMVDVVFLLIIFFLVASTFKSEKAIDINLAKSSASKINNFKEIIINIDSSGNYFFRNEKINLNDLENYLLNTQKNKNKVSIRADKNCAYIKIVDLMNVLQKNNISEIDFITK